MKPVLAAATLALLCHGCFPAHRVTRAGGLEVHTFQHDYTNVHALARAGKVLLVDSGLERNVERLEAELRAAGLSPASVVAVVLTHGHADHAGGARHFARKYGARIIAGRGDAELLAAGENDRLCPTNADARDRHAGDQAERYQPIEEALLVEGEVELAPLTGFPGRLLSVPSHTEGSLALVVGEAVFVGDLLRGGVFTRDAELHFYMCDLEANARDIRRLLAAHPEAATWFVGHFGPLTRAAVEARFGAAAPAELGGATRPGGRAQSDSLPREQASRATQGAAVK